MFIYPKGEHNQMQIGLVLLEENLMRVFRALRNLREKEGIGFLGTTSLDDQQEDIYYPNRIIRLLHKIADF